jgi:2-keto-4-pentenoate hydratase/2-oxohepta-3-ene-1,7-dioic acid hydratase in catechol pathway
MRPFRISKRLLAALVAAASAAMLGLAAARAQTPISQAPDTPFKLATFEAQGRDWPGARHARARYRRLKRAPGADSEGARDGHARRHARAHREVRHDRAAALSAGQLLAAANYTALASGMGAAGAGQPPAGQHAAGGGAMPPGQAARPAGGFDPAVIAKIDPDRDGPIMFAKSPRSTVIDPGEAYYAPPNRRIDWEGELAVVIGKETFRVPKEQAHDHVFGYSIVYDVSDRGGDPPRRVVSMFPGANWFDGKSIDRGAPFGPFIVPKEFLPNHANLRITTRVNGVVKQDGTSRDLIWNESQLIRYTSSILTLYPGDVIATGTPAGTGAERGEFLKPGDVVEIEIEGIGTLRTPIKALSERPGPTSQQ